MLDGEVPEKVDKVWGFAVQTRIGCRRKGLAALRAMAVERIAAGAGIREIVKEIGANKALVALWSRTRNAKSPSRRSSIMPAFKGYADDFQYLCDQTTDPFPVITLAKGGLA